MELTLLERVLIGGVGGGGLLIIVAIIVAVIKLFSMDDIEEACEGNPNRFLEMYAAQEKEASRRLCGIGILVGILLAFVACLFAWSAL